MATLKAVEPVTLPRRIKRQSARRFLPFLDWLIHYRQADLVGDVMAGIIVTIMLVPQSMAYTQLAGLPPQAGLYASIVPLFICGLLGTSRTLAVGPVAIVSLLVVSGLSPLAEPGSAYYLSSSTVGYEKLFNWAMAYEDEDQFVKALLSGQPEAPFYFAMMKKLNKVDRNVLVGLPQPAKLGLAELQQALNQGTVIVATRSADEFAAGHTFYLLGNFYRPEASPT